jgi:micrococcal nuclease
MASNEEPIPPALAGRQPAKVRKVLDGDTVIIVSGRGELRIRLDSIDCPEQDQPWGDTAKAGLIKLIGGRDILFEEYGLDHHGRTFATLFVEDRKTAKLLNVNERMVTLGHAWVMRQYYSHLPNDRKAQLNRLERWAKGKKVGLWRTANPVPPWKWRREAN